jgi:hypothetical protein
MNLYFDIETIPTQRPDVIEAIRAEVEAEASSKASAIRRQYKKPETVEAHLRDLYENLPELVDAAHRRTALDGGFGEVLCIGWAIDDGPVQAVCRRTAESESALIGKFLGSLPAPTSTALHWIGHNVIGFDLRFLWQRSRVLGLRPAVGLPLDGGQGIVTDLMVEWAGRWSRDKWPSLDELCRVFRLPSSKTGELNGSKVWDFAQAGRLDEIADYCRRDVEASRAIFKAMGLARTT